MPGKKDKYSWKINKTPPLIDSHSLKKHRVYHEYLIHYIQVLNSNPNVPIFKMSIVDGFSGGGEYVLESDTSQVIEGSPFKLLDATKIAETEILLKRQRQGINNSIEFDFEYFFVEKNQNAFNYLNVLLADRGYSNNIGNNIHLLNNQFHLALPNIISKIQEKSRKRRTLFILDQYGYKDVPFKSIRHIFKELPNSEIILTFATNWLIDYLSDNENYISALKKIGIEADLNISKLLQAKSESIEWRKIVQLALHDVIPRKTNAKFYTPFFINSKSKSFWLIHLSNHPKARDVMTQLHHDLQNTFSHYGDTGLMMFGYDPINDSQVTRISDIFHYQKEFNFDQIGRKTMQENMMDELPRIMRAHDGEMSFEELYLGLINSTPATEKQLKVTCSNLVTSKDIQIKEGLSLKRSANTIKGTDRIIINPQIRLWSDKD